MYVVLFWIFLVSLIFVDLPSHGTAIAWLIVRCRESVCSGFGVICGGALCDGV